MELLDKYNETVKGIHDYFGYVEDWKVIPLDDRRGLFWRLEQDDTGHGRVVYAETQKQVETESGSHYEDEIYTQRFLPKWVYRGDAYTMICVDPHVDGNKFLAIFSNALEVK